jgi:hypothetical protein
MRIERICSRNQLLIGGLYIALSFTVCFPVPCSSKVTKLLFFGNYDVLTTMILLQIPVIFANCVTN